MTAPAAVSWGAWLGWLPLGDSWAGLHGPLADAVDLHARSRSPNSSPTSCPRRRAARCRCSSAPGWSPARCAAPRSAPPAAAGRRPRRRHHRRGDRHARRRRGARAPGRGLRPRPAGRAYRGRGRHSAALPDRRGAAHDRRVRRDHHRRRPGRARARRPADRRRHDASPSSSASFSAAPASTPAACRPRRWSPAPMPRISRAARADYGVALGGASRVDMTSGQGAQGRGVARVARRRSRPGSTAWTLHRLPRPCAASNRRARSSVGGEHARPPSASSSMSAAAPSCRHAGRRQGRHPHQPLDPRARRAAAASRHRRRQLCRAGIRADVPPLRQRGDGYREGAAADRPRGRGRLGGDQGDPRGEGIAIRTRRRMHPLSRRMATASSVGVDCTDGRAGGGRARMCCWRSAGGPTPTISAWTRPGVAVDARGYIIVDDELKTNVAGHLGARATATAAAPSPTPPTTTSRSSRRTCSTATSASVSDRIPAYALYIDPPLGRAGMTEARRALGPPRPRSASGR